MVKCSVRSLTTHLCCYANTTVVRIAAAVYEVLGPTLEEMQKDIRTLKSDMMTTKNDVATLREKVGNLTDEVEQHELETTSLLAGVKSSYLPLDSKLE